MIWKITLFSQPSWASCSNGQKVIRISMVWGKLPTRPEKVRKAFVRIHFEGNSYFLQRWAIEVMAGVRVVFHSIRARLEWNLLWKRQNGREQRKNKWKNIGKLSAHMVLNLWGIPGLTHKWKLLSLPPPPPSSPPPIIQPFTPSPMTTTCPIVSTLNKR